MTHDPLCARTPTGVHYVGVCTCDLIAKVRADQVERDATIVQGFGWSPETDDADIRQVIAELRQ